MKHSISLYQEPSQPLNAQKFQRLQSDIDLISDLSAHTLKSPLHTILTYSEELEARLDSQSFPEEQKWLHIIRSDTLRMRNMITALFEYLSVEIGNDTNGGTPVDCNSILRMVLENMKRKIIQNNALISCDTLPTLMGREKYIASIFTYLIDNALTFHSKQPPIIHISATYPYQGLVEFSIRDNGIGIPEEFHKRIFILFQRLHSIDTYPGLGVGLAMCRKIIECSGGTLSIASRPEEGSTFFFTLPIEHPF